MLRCQTVVQHDPRRSDLLPILLAALPADARVVVDPGATDARRSPWRCYRACLETLEPDASHLLVVQDDAIVCRDFHAVLDLVVAAQPDDPVALFVPGVGANARRVLAACQAEQRWCELDPLTWVPAVAIVWPRHHIASLLDFYDGRNYPVTRTADDGIIGDWAKDTGTRVVACVPSLVDHPDTVRSLVGTAHFGGLNPARVACCWIGEEMSPLELAW